MFHTNKLKMTAPYHNVFKHTTDMCDKEAGDQFHKIRYFCCTNNKENDSLTTPTILSSLTMQQLITPKQ